MIIELHCHREDLEAYFHGVLTTAESILIEEHLEVCEECAVAALRLHDLEMTIQNEMTPEAHRRALHGTVLDLLRAAARSLAAAAHAKAGEWLDNVQDQLDEFSWQFVELQPVPVRSVGEGAEPTLRGEAGGVTIAAAAGSPVPALRMEGRNLVVEFGDIDPHAEPPSVFVVPMGFPDETQLAMLDWNPRSRLWYWKGAVRPGEIILVVGPPLEPV
jgi:hypothetical protein